MCETNRVLNVNTSVTKRSFEGNFNTYVFGRCIFLALSQWEMWLWHSA